MNAFFRKLGALFSAYYAYMLEYRAELILWVLAGSLPLIMMGVWSEAARSGDFSLSALEFIRYFLAVFLVRQFTIVWVIWDFEREVVEGKLSPRLLQPLDPAWHHVASHLMERLARLPFTLVLIALFFVLYPPAFWIPSWAQAGLGSLAILLAFALRFLMQYTLALLAFWVERVTALEQFHFFGVLVFLGGDRSSGGVPTTRAPGLGLDTLPLPGALSRQPLGRDPGGYSGRLWHGPGLDGPALAG